MKVRLEIKRELHFEFCDRSKVGTDLSNHFVLGEMSVIHFSKASQPIES